MKKSIVKATVLLLLINGLVIQLEAQEKNKSEASFGFRGGINMSNLYTKDVSDENVLVGFNIGIFGKLPINEMLAIEPEIYYSTKGAKNTYNNLISKGSVKYTFNYVELPVLGVVNITKNFNVKGGPYIAYLIDGKVKNESNVTLFNFENNITKDDYHRIDVGLLGGLGVDVGKISVDIRYNYGFRKVGKEKTYNGVNSTYPDGKNSVLSLNIAFAF